MRKFLLLPLLCMPGFCTTLLNETFHVTPGTLPANWFSAVAVGSGSPFVATDSNFVWAQTSSVMEIQLYTPQLHITRASITIEIDQFTESTGLDSGAVLEYSLNGSLYQDILNTGGTFLSLGYNTAVSAGFPGPDPLLEGASSRPVWANEVGSSLFQFTPAASGTLQLRYRLGSGQLGNQVTEISDFSVVQTDPTPEPGTSGHLALAGAMLLLGAKVRRRHQENRGQ